MTAKFNPLSPYTLILYIFLLIFACQSKPGTEATEKTLSAVMDDLVTAFYREFTLEQLDTIGNEFILNNLDKSEREILGTKYWIFEVNLPVTVSLMRDKSQEILPFWLSESKFEKTGLEVRNTHSVYEVWQKTYPAGIVELGINGFDKHRPVYFVSIGPKTSSDSLQILPIFPKNQHFETMDVGAFTYHDWDGLTLTEVPESLRGQKLLTTIRGRAREAHLINAFRETSFPSSGLPDQILLTWKDDPKNTLSIQWRTNNLVDKGLVQYWAHGKKDSTTVKAGKFLMEDRLLANDRYVHRFTAELTELEPGTSYQYRVGIGENWSDISQFQTQPEKLSAFSFIWFGDVHNSETWGELIQQADQNYPDNAFYIIAGDLVNTGLHRNDWDELFQYAGEPVSRKPLMAVPGNHDNQDGLGAGMYKEMFDFPTNGPDPKMEEMTYSFKYQNAQYLMIDATFPIEEQTSWIEKELSTSESDWKFVVFHFPPYNAIEPYEDIIAEWVPLFDKYQVDMVLGGHFHYYMRSGPMRAGQVVKSPETGTIYTISIGTNGKNEDAPGEEYAVVQFPASHLYQHVAINGKRLHYRVYDLEGNLKDEFTLQK